MELGHDPDGKILGILGMGGIGTAVARRALAFGFKLQYHNRRPLSPDRNPLGAKYVDFETLLRTSDAISVHLPLAGDTRGLIGKKEFEAMKDGVVIVNTARGPIIDEEALLQAMQSGKVFSAGLDVYDKEPDVNPALLTNENMVLLPHLGTATLETQVCPLRLAPILTCILDSFPFGIDFILSFCDPSDCLHKAASEANRTSLLFPTHLASPAVLCIPLLLFFLFPAINDGVVLFGEGSHIACFPMHIGCVSSFIRPSRLADSHPCSKRWSAW